MHLEVNYYEQLINNLHVNDSLWKDAFPLLRCRFWRTSTQGVKDRSMVPGSAHRLEHGMVAASQVHCLGFQTIPPTAPTGLRLADKLSVSLLHTCAQLCSCLHFVLCYSEAGVAFSIPKPSGFSTDSISSSLLGSREPSVIFLLPASPPFILKLLSSHREWKGPIAALLSEFQTTFLP